jgi:antitoxin Phd
MDELATSGILMYETLGGPMATHTFRNRLGELVEIPEVAATQAKNTFGELLDRVAASGAIAITRHDMPKAVLLSYEEFESLSNARSETLDTLSAKFEGLLERMQTPQAKKGMEAAFNATPAALGQAAVKAARRRR